MICAEYGFQKSVSSPILASHRLFTDRLPVSRTSTLVIERIARMGAHRAVADLEWAPPATYNPLREAASNFLQGKQRTARIGPKSTRVSRTSQHSCNNSNLSAIAPPTYRLCGGGLIWLTTNCGPKETRRS